MSINNYRVPCTCAACVTAVRPYLHTYPLWVQDAFKTAEAKGEKVHEGSLAGAYVEWHAPERGDPEYRFVVQDRPKKVRRAFAEAAVLGWFADDHGSLHRAIQNRKWVIAPKFGPQPLGFEVDPCWFCVRESNCVDCPHAEHDPLSLEGAAVRACLLCSVTDRQGCDECPYEYWESEE